MRNTIKEIEEFFALAIEQIKKDDIQRDMQKPFSKEEVITMVENIGLQINWILRDTDKIISDDIEECKNLYGSLPIGFYMLPVNWNDCTRIHYCQYPDGNYFVTICNEEMQTQDLDELKNWILNYR